MHITIEGKEYKLPGSLMQVTLADRILFDNEYGKYFRDDLQRILEMKDDTLKEIEFIGYHCEMAVKTLSFFGKIPLKIAENVWIDEVLIIYNNLMHGYSEDVDFANKEIKLQQEFHWQNETWVIAPPLLDQDSKMKFGEFIDAKQTAHDLYEVGEEKWSAVLGLCCIYFRKKGEAYNKELRREGGERWELLKKLPLPYAIQVGFFLSSSLLTFLIFSRSSGRQGHPEQERTLATT